MAIFLNYENLSPTDLFSLIATFLGPTILTRILHTLYYKCFLPPSASPPAGSAPYIRTHRIIFTLVSTLFFLFSTLSLTLSLPQNHYTALSLPPSATEKHLKVQWRKLSLMYHPDKVGSTPESSAFFLGLARAYEVLSDPVSRAVYDRFGETGSLEWDGVQTLRQFILQNLSGRLLTYYGSAALFVLGLSATGFMNIASGRNRIFLLAALATLDAYVITRPHLVASAPLNALLYLRLLRTGEFGFGGAKAAAAAGAVGALGGTDGLHLHLLPYELAIVLRRLVMNVELLASQLSTAWTDDTESPRALERNLGRAEVMANVLEIQAAQAMAAEFLPFQEDGQLEEASGSRRGSGSGVERLEERLVDYLVEMQMRSDEGFRQVVGGVVRKRG
ncbi:hypothetical protein DFH27DRAFT_547025 [Peziza echinospora]|nr:hypothetical protein DFH27DRAFT_547025 [Peziza echinospora]